MKKIIPFLLLCCCCFHPNLYAQFSRYIIRLKDKQGSSFNPSNPIQFLSQRAIDKRNRYRISIDETDLPVVQKYIDSILSVPNVSLLNVSKWFNQVCIRTTDANALARINSMPFVIASTAIAARPSVTQQGRNKIFDPVGLPIPPIGARPQNPTDVYNYGQSNAQVQLNNTQFLHNYGFKGNGMQLAIMDAGFYNYQSLQTFDSIRNNNQVLGTWDFVANNQSVNEDHFHGMQCLSTIAANLPGSFVGTAPNTSFYLFRTEDVSSEYPVEEQYFAAAAERADSLGVDIFSVSLGYNTFSNNQFDYTYADMNGNKTLIARAADMAAKKGIVVSVAAGNDGDKPWHYITTPADADSVLTVGAVGTNRVPALFSSFGPSSDGQVKPDVAAVGVGAVVANTFNGQPSYNNGTSFSCPIMAGVVSCLWQAFPEVNNMGIIDALRKSGDRFLQPDDRTGYGIADAKKAFVLLEKKLFTKEISNGNNCTSKIAWTAKASSRMNFVVERKMPGDVNFIAIDTQQYAGNFSLQSFLYEDDLSTINPGISISYRIKMNIGIDTSFYLDSGTVNYTSYCNPLTEKISIAPNPFNDKLTVTITRNDATNLSIMVYSQLGSLVYQLSNKAIIGEEVINIPARQWSKGTYLVSVLFNNRKQLTKKIIKQ